MHEVRDVAEAMGYSQSIRPPMVFSGIPWFGGPLRRLWEGQEYDKETCFGWRVPKPRDFEAKAWCVQTHTSKGMDASSVASLRKMKGWIPERIMDELERSGCVDGKASTAQKKVESL